MNWSENMMPTSFPEVPGAIIAASEFDLCSLEQSVVPQRSARRFLLCVAGFGAAEMEVSEDDLPELSASDLFDE